jgi:hypothetical protein
VAMDRRLDRARRIVAVALVGVAALGVRTAYASGGPGIGAGALSAPADECGSLDVEWSVDYVPALGGYGVTGADVTGMADACAGRTLRLTFTGSDGAALAQASAPVTGPRARVALAAGAEVDAARVTGVSVVVLG